MSSAAISVPSSTAPPRTARPIPAPRKTPPKTAVSSRSCVTSGKCTVASTHRQPDDRQRAAHRERAAELAVAEHDERQVDDRQPHRQRQRRRLGQEHRDAGDAAVDEMAGHQEPLETHAGREDARQTISSVLRASRRSVRIRPRV